jgi:hypothetical protein
VPAEDVMTTELRLFWIGCALVCASCAEETVSIGELRCENTRCAPPVASTSSVDDRTLEAIDAGQAQVVWTAEPPSCGEDGCKLATAAHTDPAQWVVHGDGSVTTAAAFAFPVEDEPVLRSGVSFARFDPDGALLAQARAVVRDFERDAEPDTAAPSIALAADADDRMLLAVGWVNQNPPDLAVFSVSPALETNAMFMLPGAGVPVAVASAGEDLRIATAYRGNAELARFGRSGELRWRQTALLPTTSS